MTDTRFSGDRLLAGLQEKLHPLGTSLDDLPVTGYRPGRADWTPRPAAVLVPLRMGDSPGVVLTVRSRTMTLHAGQVAFPGGRREGDESFPLGTALREAQEEIGVDASEIVPLGLLDRFDTITGYRITPVVARIDPGCRLRPCPDEVEEIFCLSLGRALDPASYRSHRVAHGSRQFRLVSIGHSRRLIWGATAAMLEQLARRLES
ncbi:MAG: CoA pyrophosphatase [Wenzhouxiangella sp.]